MEKNRTKRISIIAGILLICIAGIVLGATKYEQAQAYNNLINTANNYMDQGDYDQAIALFNQSLQYKDNPNVRQSIKLATNLKDSKSIFDNGTKLMEGKNYLSAIEEFKMIIKSDEKLYNSAQSNIEECKKRFITNNIKLANSAIESNKLDDANRYLDEVLKLDGDNAQAKDLKDNIVNKQNKQQEEKAKNPYGMTPEKALQILKNSYPTFAYIREGEMKTCPFPPYEGAPVFSFIFRNTENNRMYIGYVLMDGKFGMRFIAE